ncbi:MAG: GMC family oxidoreductase [Bacteroidetes bacterium]|nr:GMC family oxidoreductase [Bacteroidota bacterium]MCY4225520.1 GMC family oxidoreductase [Bacteroidota bacterium]
MTRYDIIIVGTGIGGGTLAWGLRNSGAKILMIERGDFLPQEPENWNPEAVFGEHRYKSNDPWETSNGHLFTPGVHYCVGGNSKVYGAALPRFRREDFRELEHEQGISPAWPMSYNDLEPYYGRAERLYGVHGCTGEDPTEPSRSSEYPFSEVSHEPQIERLSASLQKQGLHPNHLPLGVDLGRKCLRCHTCDGFPCKVHAKSDAEVCAVRPALESSDVSLWTNSIARRIIIQNDAVHAIEIDRGGELQTVQSDTLVLSCGAVNSAALLLRTEDLPDSSGLIGRNYMVHNNSALIAFRPWERNTTTFQKTISVNDWYLGDRTWPWPMGNLQMIGKVQASMLKSARPNIPLPILHFLADRSIEWWVMSEDLPDPQNHISISSHGRIQIHWKPNNLATHRQLLNRARKMLRSAGYPLSFTQQMGIETNSHQCGTLKMGNEPDISVLDPFCKMHGLKNLYVVDASFFPSSGAMNPALTIASQALRVADHLQAT